MSVTVLQQRIREKKTPLALGLRPELDKLSPKILKNFTDMFGPGAMADAEALRYHGTMLLDAAADLRDSGATLEETARWVLENRNKVHHQFFSSDMTQFRRTGRVSGAAAMVATIMNICPIMRLDDKGAIKAYGKVRGKKKAVEATVNAMEEHAQGGRDYDQKCFVCHSQCPEDARMLIDALEERFPKLKGKIRLCDIGTIIGSHSGPGTVAVFFMGDERPAMD